jgi:MFS family permease
MAAVNTRVSVATARGEFRPAPAAFLAAVVAVAAGYAYFLIFAQFGFLALVNRATVADESLLKPIIAGLTFGGVGGSVAMARLYAEARSHALLQASFAVCALGAGLALVARSAAVLFVIAALTGLGVGGVTVALAAIVRRVVGGEKLGPCLGLATGLAYGVCSLPPAFNANPPGQAMLGAAFACLGLVATRWLALCAPMPQPAGFDYRPGGVTAWVLIFLLLVGLDSAAFYTIQHTPMLKAGTWSSDRQLYTYALVHLVAAVTAGCALNRHWLGLTVLAATALLLTACWLLAHGVHAFAVDGLFYVVGVSFYSTALVFYPAHSGRPALAALLYAVAGWGGSALGIGLAERTTTIPLSVLMAAGAVLVVALFARARHRLGET